MKAFLFAGQGAQTPGMACELRLRKVDELFSIADSIKPGIVDLMRSGSIEQLSQTENTQPCMFLADLAYAYASEENGTPNAVCGFSVGEIPALTYAGALSQADGFKVILKRAELMAKAGKECGGSMIAVIGLAPEEAEEVAASVEGAWAANYNSPKQTVIAVTSEAESALIAAVTARKARAIKLKVSGAFHCPLLNGAAAEFKEFLLGVPFSTPKIPVYANLTATPYEGEIREILAKQMCSPVKFTQTVLNMREKGINEFVEVGPGKVLTGLVAKI